MAAKKNKFKVGDKVEIVSNKTGSHNAPVGETGTITQAQGNGYYRLAEFPNWNFPVGDLKLIPCTFNKVGVESEKAKLLVAVAALDAKLAYLDETGLDVACEKEYRVYQTLSLVDDKKLTKQQKAKAIAALLNEDK
jgi:hypothetical protein